MTLDLGDLAGLAKALGLVDDRDAVVTDWFAKPATYLSNVLAEDVQRAALLELAGAVMDGTATTDASGRTWLPVATAGSGFTLAAVVAEQPAEIHVGAGVSGHVEAASGVVVDIQAYVPLFATRRAPHGAVEPILLGTDRAALEVDLTVRVPPGTDVGGVALAGAALGLTMTTGRDIDAGFRLSLLGLRLPGAAAPEDVVVDGTGDIDDVILRLVFGLLGAEADGATGSLHGLAVMLGLAGPVPAFPSTTCSPAAPRRWSSGSPPPSPTPPGGPDWPSSWAPRSRSAARSVSRSAAPPSPSRSRWRPGRPHCRW